MPTSEDRERLRLVGKAYGAKAIVLSEWKKGSKAIFSRLVGDAWVKVEPDEIFSPSKKAEKTSDSQEARQSRFSISLDDVVITASPKLQSIAAKKAWITRRAGKKVDKKL